MQNSKSDDHQTPCLELRDVVKRFPGVVAVDHLNLTVEEGELFSLLGPSGCGKTTTLRLIGGLESPDEGEVLIDEKVVNTIPPYKRDSSIVFQNLALFPHMTVEENISFGLERKKVPRPQREEQITEVLRLVKLTGMKDRRPDQLSGGQQQRVALARSLVLNPKVLLLDEPLSSLDRKLRKDMQIELKGIQKEVGTTFIYVTHDQKVALSLSDRIAVMKAGCPVQIGTPSRIFEHPKTVFVADFMGAANIFTGQAHHEGSSKLTLETEEGLRLSAVCGDIDPQEVAGVCVRPEAIEMRAKDRQCSWDNLFSGRIAEEVYQGDFTEYVVVLDGGAEVVVHRSATGTTNEEGHRFERGEEVKVGWAKEDGNGLGS